MREGWEIKKISDVVIDFHQGLNTAGQKIKFVDKGYPIIQTRNLDNGRIDIKDKIKFMSTSDWELYRDKYKPRIGDVFLTNIGTIGKTAVVLKEEDYLIHWNIFIFKLNRKEITPFYLKYFLDSPSSFNYYFSSQKGGTVNFITKRMIANMAIPIPPIEEQKQIVAILDKAFTAIDQAKANIEKNIANAKELFQSKLNAIFSKKGAGWEEMTLGEIAGFKNGLNFTKSSAGDIIKLVGVADFKNRFYVPISKLVNIQIKGNLKENYYLKDGDILAVRSNGNPKLIGRCILAKGVVEKTSHSGFTIRIRPNYDLISPYYLCLFLKSSIARNKLINSGNGINIKSLNQGALSSLEISFPTSVILQEKLWIHLSEIEKKIKKIEINYIQKLEDLEELKKSILQKAFSGELTQKEVVV